MTDEAFKSRICAAFDEIHAENDLKDKTLVYLYGKINEKSKRAIPFAVKRFAVGFAFLLCVCFMGVVSYGLYFSENAYIDFDINPSVELTLNRFDRIIDIHAYNSDGESLIEGLDIKHKNYKNAIGTVLDAFAQKGFIEDSGLVSVTLQTRDTRRESELLSDIADSVEESIYGRRDSTQLDVFSVSGEVRNNAHDLNLSPAKYLAIRELQEVDPSATVEGCRGHTIGELRSITQSHGAGHHAANQAGENSSNTQAPYAPDMNSHHGGRGMHNGHRGGH